MQSQHLSTLIWSSLFIFFVVNLPGWAVQAQGLPPARFDGFLYENRQGDSDSILIEAFFDPLCSDCKYAWPPLKQLLEHHGSRVWLRLHLLPLPYHDNSYLTCRALHTANSLNASLVFPLLEQFFKHQEKFDNDATSHLSKASIVEEIVNFSTGTIGNSFYSEFKTGFYDIRTELKTRVSFKYSASRGVHGTPFFFANGFLLPDAGSPLDYDAWRSIIDPMVGAESRTHTEPLNQAL